MKLSKIIFSVLVLGSPLVSATFYSVPTFAASEVIAKVTVVRADKNGKGYIRFEQPLGGSPAECISAHANHLAFDLNTPGGQGIMSLGLTAMASGKRLKAIGTGTCDIYTQVESWSWGYIMD